MFREAFVAVHPFLYRLLGGRLLMSGTRSRPFLLLTTTGRKSGKRWTKPLLYGRDGERYIVVGSNWAGPKHAGWYYNIQADPEVELQVGGRKFAAMARITDGDERERLWKIMTDMYPNYHKYADKTAPYREIPVVALTPAT
jgi:proline iminopeptidase